MRLRLLVSVLSLIALTAFSKPVFAQEDFSVLAERFDQETHLKICGPGDENVIKSGPLHNRFKKIIDRLGFDEEVVHLINNKAFNACASTFSIFIFSGVFEKEISDDEIAFIIEHEGTHKGEQHLKNQYEKNVENANAVNRAVESLNKPGYEENAVVGRKIGTAVAVLFSLKYSRDDEDKADAGGIAGVIDHGYDPEKALLVFDKIPGGFKGFLTTFSSHPDSQKRKERARKSIGTHNVELANKVVYEKSIKGIRKAVSPEAWLKQVNGDYAGYAHAYLNKNQVILMLLKGSGEIQKDKKGRFCIPAGTQEVFFIATNPNPNLYFDVYNIVFDPSEKVYEYHYPKYKFWNHCYGAHEKYLVFRIPVELLFVSNRVEFNYYLAKNENSLNPEGTAIILGNTHDKQIYASFTK